MIDLSQLTEEQLNELELKVQEHRKRQREKQVFDALKGYKVTFYVRFDPEKHENDMLTNDGELDTGLFTDYLCNSIVVDLIEKLHLYDYEDVSCPVVEIATRQEVEGEF